MTTVNEKKKEKKYSQKKKGNRDKFVRRGGKWRNLAVDNREEGKGE